MTNPTIRELHGQMQRRWPKVFCTPPRPLKLGIHHDLVAAGMAEIDVARGVSMWTRSRSYLLKLREGVPRVDLDGEPAGEVTAEQAAHAVERLADLRAKQEAERASVEPVSAKPAAEPERPASPPRRASFADLRAAAQRRAKQTA